MRDYRLIPECLSPRENLILFERHNQLKNNPMSVKVGEEEIFLKPMSRHDRPRFSPTFTEVLKLAETDEDWSNVVKLLEAYHDRGHLKLKNKAHLIRRACEVDRSSLVLQCLGTPKKTGLVLSDRSILEHVLWDVVHMEPVKHDWSPGACDTAFKRAKQIAESMMREEHASDDLATRSWVLGYLLETAAMNAKANQGGEDSDGSVRLYAERTLSATRTTPFQVSLLSTELREYQLDTDSHVVAREQLRTQKCKYQEQNKRGYQEM